MAKTKDKPSYPRIKLGSKLAKTLKLVKRNVNQWPLTHQRAERTWTRDELLLSGMDLKAEAKARKEAARKMKSGRSYTNQEVGKLVKKARS